MSLVGAWAADGRSEPAREQRQRAGTKPRADLEAWFAKQQRNGQWCVLDKRTFDGRSARGDFAPDETGWIRYSAKGVETVSIQTQSEDASVVDRYDFNVAGLVTRLVRTGHYIEAPEASFTYLPDRRGRLVLAPASREAVRRLNRAGHETYVVEWPRYRRLKDLPFASRIRSVKPVQVRLGCATTPRSAPR